MRTACTSCDVCTVCSWLVAVVNGTIIPVLALATGVVYEERCPLEPRMTSYLYVTSALCIGCFVHSVTSACCIQRPRCPYYERCNENRCFYPLLIIEIVFNVAMFGWIIVGSVWVYRHRNILHTDQAACDKTFYLVTFVLITAQWILFALHHVITFIHTSCFKKPPDIGQIPDKDSHKTRKYVIVDNRENNNRL